MCWWLTPRHLLCVFRTPAICCCCWRYSTHHGNTTELMGIFAYAVKAQCYYYHHSVWYFCCSVSYLDLLWYLFRCPHFVVKYVFRFGGGPAVNRLSACKPCIQEAERLHKRQQMEKQAFLEVKFTWVLYVSCMTYHSILVPLVGHLLRIWLSFLRFLTLIGFLCLRPM